MSKDNENYGFLETHYYFTDSSHSMNAFVKNKCDRALLTIFEEATKELKCEKGIKLEVLPLSEGSLIELFKIVATAENIALANLLVLAWQLVLSRKPPLATETAIDIENKKLANEKMKLEIIQIKKQLAETETVAQTTENSTNQDDSQEIEKKFSDLKEAVYELLISNFIIRKNLSVFYENIIGYEKIKAIGYTTYDKNYKVIIPEKTVERDDFKNFVLDLDEFEEIDEEAKINIFSPNLVRGRHKWRGLYEKEGKIIEFNLNDKDFKNNVESGTITFKNGSMIKAVLTIKIKLDISGNETSRIYSVDTVLEYSYDGGHAETSQGKKYKANKKDAEAQISFPFDDKK